MSSPLRIVVTGQMAQYPLGGVTWFYLQYVLGLARLGHDVYYIEDSWQWPYNPVAGALAKDDCSYNIDYLAGIMARFGLPLRWAYRVGREWEWYGMTDLAREEVIETADLLLNVSGTFGQPEQYRSIPRLAYLDTDPVFTQVKLAQGQPDIRALVDAHDIHFSYGEIASETVPETGHRWRPTRAPIVLSEWRTGKPYREVYTTVSNWTAFEAIEYGGLTYGQKDVEFERFFDLPQSVAPVALEIALGAGKTHHPPVALMRAKGFSIVDPLVVCLDLDSFRAYTESSKGEWGVAKHGYVLGNSGWFSERSARYLAAGRPTIVQDTGFSRTLPAGEGLLPFRTLDEAAAAIREVEGNYARHGRAARAIAEAYFDSDKVLADLVDVAMSTCDSAAESASQTS